MDSGFDQPQHIGALVNAAFADNQLAGGIRFAKRSVTARSVVKVLRSRLLMPISRASGIALIRYRVRAHDGSRSRTSRLSPLASA